MTNELRRALAAHLPRGAHAVCAVSGGPDSMALLCLAHATAGALGIRVTCAHFNHGLRAAESDGDEAFVREQCAARGIAFCSGRADIRAARAPGESLEAAARRLRYAFLLSVDPDAFVLTAHTADDNLETVLMHLIRGASLRGLAGIPPVRGRIVRPLLGITRAQILDYLTREKIPYRIDSSNELDAFLRNRLRHHVVPQLAAENPSIAVRVQEASARLRAEDELLDTLALQALSSARRGDALSCTVLRSHPVALRRRAVRLFLLACGVSELSARQIEAVCALADSPHPAAEVDLCSGFRAAREYDLLRVQCGDIPDGFVPTQLRIPGRTALPGAGMTVVCRLAQAHQIDDIPCDFAVHYTGGTITARPRRSGDTLRLAGGRRSLKKLMIDRKIPAVQRSRVPVFCDAGGILAVAGIGADVSRLPRAGEPALYIQLEKEASCHEPA